MTLSCTNYEHGGTIIKLSKKVVDNFGSRIEYCVNVLPHISLCCYES